MLNLLNMSPPGKELICTAYGLAISSRIPLPELRPLEARGSIQVSINSGFVSAELEGRTGGSGLFQVAPTKFLLNIASVARYLVSGGNQITIDAAAGADHDSVRLFLLGSVFGALLHQRGLLPLHASAIETPKGAVLFAGGSATGKSALAAAFLARGYRVIADEICALNRMGAAAEALPALRRLLLWPDALEQSGLGAANARPARSNLKKYHVPLETGFATHPSPIHAVYILKVSNTSKADITRVGGLEKFQELTDLTFRRQFLSGMCAPNAYFEQVAAVSRGVQVLRFGRPSGWTVQETANVLERDFDQ